MRKLTLIFTLLLLSIPARAGVGRVQVSLLVGNQAVAETVGSALTAFMEAAAINCSENEPSTLPRTMEHPTRANVWLVLAELCFRDRTIADRLKTRIRNAWTDGGLSSVILRGSKVVFHLCEHEDGRYQCSRPVNLLERLSKQ